ncbi:MAG: phospho-N-acetylmuramoyl-pentapeptide-transferase [Actinomycetes bacterium]|jgi:phospho-N-acetylmuramoyl-pentapeptide-transferase|nr:phospho-N-acetylmuramoyl-pentapeptide-transferase [Actinomycetes bacterium]
MLTKLAQYPTFQVFLVLAASVGFVALVTPLLIRFLKQHGIGQEIRAEGLREHLVKKGTPTMGGIVILVVAALLFALMTSFAYPDLAVSSAKKIANFNRGIKCAVVVLVGMLGCGALGFIDDVTKVVHKRSLGLSAVAKIIGQVTIALVTTMLAVNWAHVSCDLQLPATTIHVPLDIWATRIMLPVGVAAHFGVDGALVIPWVYLAFALIMIVGMSNATNLTDGLDGLAAGCVMIVGIVYAAIAYAQNSLPVSLVAAAVAGGCVGFLWWNCHPADIFMGDTGSLGLGGAIAALAMVTKTELLVVVIGGIFVIEALSVIIQVAVFKRTRRRVFRMAPIHHHFEMCGWSETKVMVRFWVITGTLAALGFCIYFFQSTRLGG